jgi:hypothetical protein
MVEKNITDTKKSKKSSGNLIYLCVVLISVFMVITVWVMFPYILPYLNNHDLERGAFGDQFGSLNTLFTGLAFSLLICTTLMQSRELKLQRDELEQTREAFEESTDLQAKNLSGSLLLPIFQYTRNECGKYLGVLANNWRNIARKALGDEDSSSLVKRIKDNPHAQKTTDDLEKVRELLVTEYSGLRIKKNKGSWSGENDPDKKKFEEWDNARRMISIVGQQVFQIQSAKLVKGEVIVRFHYVVP